MSKRGGARLRAQPPPGCAGLMNYQWDVPYAIDDGDFRRTFAVGPTELDEAIDATLATHAKTKVLGRAA